MVRRVFIISLSIVMLSFTALALAGGPPMAAAPCFPPPCGPYPVKPYAAGPACAYWGDAPFPGLCGGIVALPFLVVGSLLGGNTMGPCGAPPVAAQCGPRPYPAKVYAPAPCGPPPCGPPPCGPTAYGFGGGDSIFSSLPCLELCSGLLGGFTGGPSLLW
jgi:hypothetical protein